MQPPAATLVSYQQTKPITRAARPPRQPKTQPASSATPYLATFNENVHITQGEDLVANADRMDVDFLTKQESDATTQPTTSPTTNRSSSTTQASTAVATGL